MHKSRCVLKWLHNLFFMKAIVINVRMSSIDLISCRIVISASFMYFERLRFKIANVEVLCQSLIRGLT